MVSEVKLNDGFGEVAKEIASHDSSGTAGRKAHEVGKPLPDGTVCIAVDPEKNKALFVPKAIFGGSATFDDQHKIVERVNAGRLHGHKDWREMKDSECETLCNVWDKVAPPELQGNAAPAFWTPSPVYYISGAGGFRRGGDMSLYGSNRDNLHPIPVVRDGPALI